jgi:hypothetical protein
MHLLVKKNAEKEVKENAPKEVSKKTDARLINS